jgi:hypothetical protein
MNNVVPLILGDYLYVGEIPIKRDGNPPSIEEACQLS